MLWTAATFCFFSFFRAEEITVLSLTSFKPTKHLVWGDVAIDDAMNPQALRVCLKKTKNDQLDKGVEVYIGKTDCPLCPVQAVLGFMAIRTWDTVGPIFQIRKWTTPYQSSFYNTYSQSITGCRSP